MVVSWKEIQEGGDICISMADLMLMYGRNQASLFVSSAGKEFTCNAGDPGLIPGFGRSPGEGTGYPLKFSWTSFVAQLVKNLPAMQETWV